MPPIWIDADQIRQVLLNMLRNALHAMKGEGMLSVVTEATNNAVRIYVADTGEGIRADHVDKVFNAFFTTKNHRIRLGLTISMQIVKSHAAPSKWTAVKARINLYHYAAAAKRGGFA